MRSFFQKKGWILLLATLALVSLTVLATSLDELSFRAGQRYRPEPAATLPPIDSEAAQATYASVPLWKQLTLWGMLGVLIFLAGLLLSPQQRKRFFYMVLRVAISLAALYFLFTKTDILEQFQGLLNGWEQAGENPAAYGDVPPMPDFQPPQVSPVVSYMVSFGVALVFIAAAWALYRGWRRYSAWNKPRPLEDIAHIARTSLKDLSSGRDTSDVIINCYMRMSDVVADKRRLHREAAMTPQEFAVRLERAGLPGEAVRRLTGLFEVVRYGDRKTAPRDVTEAVNCLNAILRSCGETP